MTDPLGLAPPLPTTPVAPPPAVAQGAELPLPLLALQDAVNFAATVVGRSPEGAVLLQSAYGALTLKTNLPLPAGARVELRFQPGNPPSIAVLGAAAAESGAAEPSQPPMRFGPGTTTVATMLTAASGGAAALPEGARLLLQVVTPSAAGPNALVGQVATGPAGETLVETPVGTLALDLKVALPPGTKIAFERLGEFAPTTEPDPQPSQTRSWPSLEQALAVLDKAAPGLAQQLRNTLAPNTPAALAGTLLFLAGAIYAGRWPAEAVNRALAAAGADRLRLKLGSDLAELGRLKSDDATGRWQVLVLPLAAGPTVEPVRLYLRRRGQQGDAPDDGARFVFETELSRIGALQLDGLVRGKRLDLVLRSHTPLSPEMQQEAAALFRRASDANGLHGDIVFATAVQFDVSPMAALQRHVAVQA